MAQTPTNKRSTSSTPVDPKQLPSGKFQEFCQHMKHSWIESRGISRASFMAVTFALSRHCEFETGEKIRVSQAALVDESGCSHNTVRRVVAFLKEVGVLEVVDLQRRQGSPSENYRFRLNHNVKLVLDEKDRGPKGKVSPRTTEPVSTDSQAVSTDTVHVSTDSLGVSTDNNKVNKVLESASVVETPSASPTALSAKASEEKNDDDWDEFVESIRDLDEKKNQPSMDERWQQLVARVER